MQSYNKKEEPLPFLKAERWSHILQAMPANNGSDMTRPSKIVDREIWAYCVNVRDKEQKWKQQGERRQASRERRSIFGIEELQIKVSKLGGKVTVTQSPK